MPISPLDFVLLQFGSPGYYQIFLGFLLCCLQLPIIFTEYLFRHYTFEPPHRCLLTGRQMRMHDSLGGLNLHKNEWFPVIGQLPQNQGNPNLPLVEQLIVQPNSSSAQFDQCNVYIDPINHYKGTRPCPGGWEFWVPNNEQNLVTEFLLVCDRKYYVDLLFYVSCIAAFSGAILLGLLGDKWGRHTTLHFSIYLFVASSLSAYFAVDFIQFAVFYTLQVFFISGLHMCVFVLLVELLPTPFQLQASVVWAVFRVLTSLLVPVLVSAIHDWRYMQLSIAVPSFAFFTYIFVLPASPLWLTTVKHNLPAAFETLCLFGKFSGKELSSNQLKQHIQNLYTSSLTFVSSDCSVSSSTSNLNQQSTIRRQSLSTRPKLSKPGPVLRWYLLTHFYLFFVVSLINSELVEQQALILHQNSQINTVYTAFLYLGVLILTYHLSLWLNGRIVQTLLFLLTGTLIVGAIVLREYLKSRAHSDPDDPAFDYRLFLLPPILIVVARSLNFAAIAFIWFHAVKTIPTKIRVSGLGFCYFWTQIAKMSTPHLIVLSNFLSHNQVLIVLGVMAILGSALTFLYSSVDHRPLPNTLEDLQPNKCRNSLNYNTFKRYPSYQDLKRDRASQNRGSAANIYTISPTDGPFSQPNSLQVTQAKRAHSDFTYDPHNLTRHTAIGQGVDLKELMTLIQQTSISSGSARMGHDTEKSSLDSSSQDNNTNVQSSLIQMSPSTSFSARRISSSTNQMPTYIAYSNASLDPEGDIFAVELNNEVTVENAHPSQIMRPTFAYARNLSS